MEITLNSNFFAIENGDLELINGGSVWGAIVGGLLCIGGLVTAIALAPSVASVGLASVIFYYAGTALLAIGAGITAYACL